MRPHTTPGRAREPARARPGRRWPRTAGPDGSAHRAGNPLRPTRVRAIAPGVGAGIAAHRIPSGLLLVAALCATTAVPAGAAVVAAQAVDGSPRAISVGVDGTAHLVTADPGFAELRLAAASPTGAFGPLTTLGAFAEVVAVAADGSGVLLPRSSDRGRLQVQAFGPDGRRSAPQILAFRGVEPVSEQLALGADGTAIVAWQTRDGGRLRARFAVRRPGAAFGPVQAFAGRSALGDDVEVAAGARGNGLIATRDRVVLVRSGRVRATRRIVNAGYGTPVAMGADGTGLYTTRVARAGGREALRAARLAPGDVMVPPPMTFASRRRTRDPDLPIPVVGPDGGVAIVAPPYARPVLAAGAGFRTRLRVPLSFDVRPQVLLGTAGALAIIGDVETSTRDTIGVALRPASGRLAVTTLAQPRDPADALESGPTAFAPDGTLLVSSTRTGGATALSAAFLGATVTRIAG